MTNAEQNTALYKKMFAEQEAYRAWLLSQPPTEILNHAYEYTVREDILLSLEYHNLPDAQARALRRSISPLADVFRDWQDKETAIWTTSGPPWRRGPRLKPPSSSNSDRNRKRTWSGKLL